MRKASLEMTLTHWGMYQNYRIWKTRPYRWL